MSFKFHSRNRTAEASTNWIGVTGASLDVGKRAVMWQQSAAVDWIIYSSLADSSLAWISRRHEARQLLPLVLSTTASRLEATA